MAFEWTNDLETGNSQIDNEHKKLINAINDLLKACSQGKGRQELNGAVEFLQEYTKTHFNHEEKLQITHKYPFYENHKAWHESYIKQIDDIASKLKADGPTIIVLGDVNLKASLLISHIKLEDRKLAKYIQENNL